MTQRTIAFLLVAAFGGLSLLACSNNATKDPGAATTNKTAADKASTEELATEPVEIVLWHSYRAKERQALEKVVANWNAERTDIKVKTLQIPHQAYADKITAAIPRDNGPDIFIFAHDRVGDWAEADILEPVSSWARPELLQSYLPSTVKALVYKKSLYGLPLAFKSVVLFYNKDLVEKPPTTDEELIAIAKKNTDAEAKEYGLVYENTSLYFSAPFIHGYRGSIMDAEGNVQLASQGTVDGLAFAHQLLHTHKVLPEDVNANLVTTLFNEKKAAMVINGPWFRGEIAEGVNWGVAPMPTITKTGEPMRPYVGSEGVLLSRKSAHKEQAFEVMKYLAGADSAAVRLKLGGQPVANTAAWNGEAADDPTLAVFRKQLDDAVVMPNTSRMKAVWSPADQAVYKIVKSGEEPTEVMKLTEARIAQSLK